MGNHFYELQFEIENNCLLNCIHCSSYETRQRNNRKYSNKDLIEFLHLFPGKTKIYFTGGEPLLNLNLLEICQEITSKYKNSEIGLYTTGNFSCKKHITAETAISMRKAGISECYFSIYSDLQHEHDEWTNYQGSFANTIKSIENIIHAGIIAKAHLVLSKINYYKINSIIEFCKKIGIQEIRILKLVCTGNAEIHWGKIGLENSMQDDIIHELILSRKNYDIKLTFSGYPEMHPCRTFENANKCQAGTHLLYIDSNGDIYPCACTKHHLSKFKIGNIIDLDNIKNYLDKQSPEGYRNYCLNKIMI